MSREIAAFLEFLLKAAPHIIEEVTKLAEDYESQAAAPPGPAQPSINEAVDAFIDRRFPVSTKPLAISHLADVDTQELVTELARRSVENLS